MRERVGGEFIHSFSAVVAPGRVCGRSMKMMMMMSVCERSEQQRWRIEGCGDDDNELLFQITSVGRHSVSLTEL